MNAEAEVAHVSLPFAVAPRQILAFPGETLRIVLARAIDAGALPVGDLERTVVYRNGVALEREETLDAIINGGDQINVVVEPEGGGGRKKDVGQVLFQLVIIAASAWVGGGGLAFLGASTLVRAVAAAAVMAVGSAVSAELFKPEATGGSSGDKFALQGATNQWRPWQSMPLALGAVVVAPDMAAKTFTRNIGDDNWIFGILGLHYGPCAVSELRIGDTLVSSLGADEFAMVEHLAPGPRTFSLYPNDTDQLDLTEELNKDGATAVVRAAGSDGETFELDFFLPEGLHFAKDDGRVINASVSVTVRVRPLDDLGLPAGAWTAGGSFSLTNKTREPVRHTLTIQRPLGRYEFEVIRNVPDDANEKRHDMIVLVAIKAIAFRKPVADEVLSIIEFKVKATSLNQGTLAAITCRVEPICEVWDAVSADWTAPEPTSNPAALTRWLMTGPAPAKPLALDQADTGLTDWYDTCEQYDWMAGLYITADQSQKDVLALIEAAGRASLWWDGQALQAACWAERAAPRQLFTGRNLRDRSGSIVYPEVVHALRVEFANIAERGEADEVYVYASGYGPMADPEADPPLLAASRVEAFRVDGQRSIQRAYRDGVWELERRRLQRRVETWMTDVEYLSASYGDRVLLSWRGVAEGLGEARVRARRFAGGLVTGLRLDQDVEMEAGEDYAADLRFAGQTVRGVDLVTTAGASREIVFATPRAVEDSPAAGDLIAWGKAGTVTSDLELVGIEPAEDLTARLTGRKYVAPALIAAEQADLPGLTTGLTGSSRRKPPTPFLLGTQGAASGVRVSFSVAPWSGSPIVSITARWRVTPDDPDAGGWTDLPPLAASGRMLTTPPPRLLPTLAGDDRDATLDVEVRTVTAAGQVSDPLIVSGILIDRDLGDPTPGGDPGVRDPTRRDTISGTAPGTVTQSEVAIEAHIAVFATGEVLPLPDGAVEDLDASTKYGIFWRADEGYTAAPFPALTLARTGRRIFVGWHTTTDSVGTYPLPIELPPGSGGGGTIPAEPIAEI